MRLFSKFRFRKTNNHIENGISQDVQPKEDISQSNSQYIEVDDSIQRVDGKPFSDEEVPYLMQLSYEKALEKEGIYNHEVLDLSFMQEMDKNKKKYTALPTVDELSSIAYQEITFTSTDIFFLKYIDGRTLENPSIAQYWFYEYDINYSEEIKKLIAGKLLIVQNVNIEKLKVDELKDILRNFSLPVSGKKQDLQSRILENVSYEELSKFLGNKVHYFCATEKGKKLINITQESATKNLELEDDCIDLIMKSDYESAYNLISAFKHNTPAGAHLRFEYNKLRDEKYRSIMNSHSFFYTLEKDREIEDKIRAAVTFCRMYGIGQDGIKKIINRMYTQNGHIFSNDAKNIIRGRLL